MELLGILVLLFVGGVFAFFAALLILPFVLLAKVIGWGVHAAANVVGWVLGALLLVPLGLLLLPVGAFVALVGGLILLKLLLLAAPLLLMIAAVWLFVSLVRRPAVA